MASQHTTASIDRVKSRINTGKERLSSIRASANATEPELAAAAEDFQDSLDSALELADRLANDAEWWPTAKRFIRRLTSREFIITVVAIAAIWTGGLDSQEALAVAVAGGGLALGRGVAKRSGGTDS